MKISILLAFLLLCQGAIVIKQVPRQTQEIFGGQLQPQMPGQGGSQRPGQGGQGFQGQGQGNQMPPMPGQGGSQRPGQGGQGFQGQGFQGQGHQGPQTPGQDGYQRHGQGVQAPGQNGQGGFQIPRGIQIPGLNNAPGQGQGGVGIPTPEDLQKLQSQLPPEAQGLLDGLISKQQERRESENGQNIGLQEIAKFLGENGQYQGNNQDIPDLNKLLQAAQLAAQQAAQQGGGQQGEQQVTDLNQLIAGFQQGLDEQSWWVQKLYLRGAVSDALSYYLEQSNIPEDEQPAIKSSLLFALERTFDFYDKATPTQQMNIRKFFQGLPRVTRQMMLTNSQYENNFSEDMRYFSSLSRDRQQNLFEYMTFNISQIVQPMDSDNEMTEMTKIIETIHTIIEDDRAELDRIYTVPEEYQQDEGTVAPASLNDMLANQDTVNRLGEMLKKSQTPAMDWHKLNETVSQTLEQVLPQAQQALNITDTEKENMKQKLGQLVSAANQTMSNEKGTQQAAQVPAPAPEPEGVPMWVLGSLVFISVLLAGLFLKRRNTLKERQTQYVQDPNAIDYVSDKPEEVGQRGFVQA